jgi:hypothetical protein
MTLEFMGPREPGAGAEPDRAAIEARVHTVAVELDFVEPIVAFRHRLDQLRELRRDPFRQNGASTAAAGYRSRGAGGGKGANAAGACVWKSLAICRRRAVKTRKVCSPTSRTRVILEDADRRHSVVWRIDYVVGPKARDIADDRVMAA